MILIHHLTWGFSQHFSDRNSFRKLQMESNQIFCKPWPRAEYQYCWASVCYKTVSTFGLNKHFDLEKSSENSLLFHFKCNSNKTLDPMQDLNGWNVGERWDIYRWMNQMENELKTTLRPIVGYAPLMQTAELQEKLGKICND